MFATKDQSPTPTLTKAVARNTTTPETPAAKRTKRLAAKNVGRDASPVEDEEAAEAGDQAEAHFDEQVACVCVFVFVFAGAPRQQGIACEPGRRGGHKTSTVWTN